MCFGSPSANDAAGRGLGEKALSFAAGHPGLQNYMKVDQVVVYWRKPQQEQHQGLREFSVAALILLNYGVSP